jgi:hypothetical protein
MGEKIKAQISGQRVILDSLNREFALLHSRSSQLIQQMSDETIYLTPTNSQHSVGESILKSAAEVEQTFGGITANLWDDPFEWTLPEHLSTTTKIIDHLGEVEALRRRAFISFTDDSCLTKRVATPSDTRPLIDLLLGTLLRAREHQAEAVVMLNSR